MKPLLYKIPLCLRLPILILLIGLMLGIPVAMFTDGNWSTVFITAGIFFVGFYIAACTGFLGFLYELSEKRAERKNGF